jgi:hypothetical protein
MGKYYPEAVKASHVNLVLAPPINLLWHPLRALQLLVTPLTSLEWTGIWQSFDYQNNGSGYFDIQRTRPQSIGYLLADSPVGLLGWIWEKLNHWTDDFAWTDDEILTWVSIYWFSTAGPAASVRIYHESMRQPKDFACWTWNKVPMGLAYFPKDIIYVPRVLGRTIGPVVHEFHATDGGHFASYEKPEELAADVKKMFGREGGAFGVVSGRSGYVGEKKDL